MNLSLQKFAQFTHKLYIYIFPEAFSLSEHKTQTQSSYNWEL